ncbi:MAG TPA: FtsX-like permease family protein [Candidatus Thermoplasmatota archaeon]|nr:FtsX-like permease family protein [Candidatus Thermoplasmatota archaeon]
MWLLPWHVTMSPDRKAVLTAIGISLGAAFAFIGLAVPEALEVLSSRDDPFLGQRHDLVMRSDGARFDVPAALDEPRATRYHLLDARLDDGSRVQVAALVGAEALEIAPSEVVPSDGANLVGSAITFIEPTEATLEVAPAQEARVYGRTWLLVAPETMARLDPAYAPERADFVLAPLLPRDVAAQLRAEGFVVERVPALDSFFRASGREVAFDLILVVGFSSVLVALFSYEFLRSEVRERRREIGLWRGIGLRARDVMALLVGRATAIAAAGTLAGLLLALGGIGFVGRVLQLDILRPQLSFWRAATVALALLLAGILGGVLPAYAASRASVSASLEAET